MSTKSEIRAALLGNSFVAPSKVVTLTIGETELQIELRTPFKAERDRLLMKSRSKDGEIDPTTLTVEALLACAFEPGTDEKAFGPADRDMIANTPAGSPLDMLSQQAAAMLNPDADGELNPKN